MNEEKLKFCKFCGEKIPEDAVICIKCGRQVEEIKKSNSENVIINNNVNASASANVRTVSYGKLCNKWVSLILCIFFRGFRNT